MKKLLILILTFSLFSCSVNNNVEENDFVIGNFNGYFEENIDLENIYKTEKNIYLVGSGLVSKPKCLEEVYEIIPEICEN